ncbi:cache domain-containing sensor histidine kinase [Paenibacillus arenilitoris]|uniref:Histidine kinase n=1 Tax=Paenibacillus arenilitoris TaxID=2772299 RepID=A0A927CS94_9BACL|nr:sensor histidine kinase [Paenibacillus arenilitoris]MBD2871958.1 histidine kinase [Paenibacillus arenilitoris]
MKFRSLYAKLTFQFLVIIGLTLSGVGISYTTSSRELDELAEKQMEQVVRNAVHHTDLYLKDYERSMVSLLTLRYVMEFMDLPADREAYDYYYYRKMIREVVADPLFIRNPKIADIYMISDEGNAVYYYNETDEQSFTKEDIRKHRDFLMSNTSPQGHLSILKNSIIPGEQNQMVTLVRRIRGYSSSELSGLLAIELRSADLSALWKGVDLGKFGYLFIADANGNIVYHPDEAKVGSELSAPVRDKLEKAGNGAFFDDGDGENRMYMASTSDYSRWKLIVSMPVDEVRKPVTNIRNATLTVGLFTLLIAILLAYRFSRSINRPIQTLKSAMRLTERGNWQPIPLPKHRDEMAELMLRYNHMVKRLSDAVDKVVQVELSNQEIRLERQRAEFQSLQLQINPHFMYNTLETIVCYAAVQDSDEISEIVQSLAYMLRYSVQTNLEKITLANELKHVMYYMKVMQHRISRAFEIEVAVRPDDLLHAMVRLTLQPIVENVFQHAFPEGVEDYHQIRIDAGETNGIFWVSVEDNGCGMPAERLAELRRKLEANRLADDERQDETGHKSGIGMLNVHRRIQMVFGDGFGIRIASEEHLGTKVTMLMPQGRRVSGK